METRARKRARVADYNYDDGVAERSAKRMKKEPKIKQEIKKEVKQIKKEPTTRVKKESKIAIKSEVKLNVKTEKKEKMEKKVKIKIEKVEPTQDEEQTELQSNERNESNDISDSSSSIDTSGSESSEDADELFADSAKYNFDSFKTILLPRKKTLKWANPAIQNKTHLNGDVIAVIISHFEFPEITIWTRVSKSTSNVVYSAQLLWKKFFRENEWRLPYEIRNKCFFFASEKPIPQLQIDDDKVDWFSEFQRNYKTCSTIRRIVTKAMAEDDEEPDFKASRVRIRRWENENNYYLPNDMREYYMCSPDSELIFLPPIDELGPVFNSELNPPFINLNGFYAKEPPNGFEDDQTEAIPDLDSLSKLLEVPKSKLTEDVYGILHLETGRGSCTVFVPYVNRIYTAAEANEVANTYCDDSTVLEELIQL